jgi:N6-adenosine-specific RNA methylase IME4
MNEEQKISQSCILWRNEDSTIILIDIPRSLEESQVLPGQTFTRRVLSSGPISAPLPTPEPRDADARQMALPPAALLSELMTGEAVKAALQELKANYSGPRCLPRITEKVPASEAQQAREASSSEYFIPENSKCLDGSVEDLADEFNSTAPVFDLIILDPPWPNRSARRIRASYATAYNLDATRDLLSRIPISAHLSMNGHVAVWVTNKHSLTELLTSPNGLFAFWGLEKVAEWVWLKVTSSGEPIFDVESSWRKPWERLLIARRRGRQGGPLGDRRVLIGVPDVHSRKPNLRCLFDEILPTEHKALEVFARNLTVGWWSWGDEVLRFQSADHWVDSSPEDEARASGEQDHREQTGK